MWHLIDATGWIVGRLAVHVSKLLQGKHKPTFDPGANCGDNVVVINADKVEFSGNKWRDKLYIHHTGYPGGLRKIPASRYRKNFPERILQKAIHGMLPHNKLRGRRENKLFIYAGEEHPHKQLQFYTEKLPLSFSAQPVKGKAVGEMQSVEGFGTFQVEVKNLGEHSRFSLYTQQALTERDLFMKEWVVLQNEHKSKTKLYQLGKGKKPAKFAFQNFEEFYKKRLEEELSKPIPFEGYEILEPQRYKELVESDVHLLKPYQLSQLVQPDEQLEHAKKAIFNPPKKYLDSSPVMDLSKPDYETPWTPGTRKFNFIKSNEHGNYIPTKSELDQLQTQQEFLSLPWPQDDPQLSKGPVKLFIENEDSLPKNTSHFKSSKKNSNKKKAEKKEKREKKEKVEEPK